MDMMRSAAKWLEQQREAFCSEKVEYIRFKDDVPHVTELSACRGRTIFRAEDTYGVVVRVASVDFLISASTLGFEPEKGDEIHADGKRYEVLAPNNEPVWRWSDNSGKSLRVHTKCTGDINEW